MDGLDVKLELAHDHVRAQDDCVLTFRCVFMNPDARRVMYDTNFVAQVTRRIKNTIDTMFEEYHTRLEHAAPVSPTTPLTDHVRSLGSLRRVVHLEHYAGKSCSVCQSNYLVNEFVRTLPVCKHIFHKRCIDPWIKRNQHPTCPVCREVIHTSSTRTENYEPERPTLE